MASLIPYDRQGIVGPVLSLMFNREDINVNGTVKLCDKISEARRKVFQEDNPLGEPEFRNWMIERVAYGQPPSPTEMIGTSYFQAMIAGPPCPPRHLWVIEMLAARKLAEAKKFFPQLEEKNSENEAILHWTASLYETTLSDNEILLQSQSFPCESDLQAERVSIWKEVKSAYDDQKLSMSDFDALLDLIRAIMAQCTKTTHPNVLLEHISTDAKDTNKGEFFNAFDFLGLMTLSRERRQLASKLNNPVLTFELSAKYARLIAQSPDPHGYACDIIKKMQMWKITVT